MERCVECGADLFAVPAPTPPILVMFGGLLFVLLGAVDLLIMAGMENRSEPSRPNLAFAWLLYQFVGKWPLPIVMWGIGAQLLLRARREMILKKRPQTVDRLSSNHSSSSTTVTVATTSANTPRLHHFLMVGLIAAATLMLMVRYRGVDPELSADLKTIVEYVCSGGSVVLVAVALIVFKPRVPGRRPEQSVSQYWSTPDVAASVSLVWFLMEGGGMIAAVGYFLTGSLLSEITMSLAIAAFWLCGPGRFAKHGSETPA